MRSGKPIPQETVASLQISEVNYATGQHTAEYGDFRNALKAMLSLSASSPPYSMEDIRRAIHCTGNVMDSFDSGVSAFDFQAKFIDADSAKLLEMSTDSQGFPLYVAHPPLPNLRRATENLKLN